MKIKLIFLAPFFLTLVVLLVSCAGNQTISTSPLEFPAAEEPASPAEEDITSIPTADEPVSTQELLPQTSEPYSEEQAPTTEPAPTEEIVATDDLVPTETPEITDQVFPTEELIETEELADTEEPVEAEDSLSIEPAEGFWAISSHAGQMTTVIPIDWSRPDDFVFFELNAESFATPNEEIFLQIYASPDEKAFICYLAYSDTTITNWTQTLAQERTLRILNELYTNNANDIEVIAVQSMMDGSERLTWSSKACNCTGVIAYKAGPPIEGTVVHQKYLSLFNTLSINPYASTYVDIFDYALELLTFPPEVSRINP
jgi:hypothetical protein